MKDFFVTNKPQNNPWFPLPHIAKAVSVFIFTTSVFLLARTTGVLWGGDPLESDVLEETKDAEYDQRRGLNALEQAPQANINLGNTNVSQALLGRLNISDVTDMHIRNDVAYVTMGAAGFQIVNVSDPNSPMTLGEYSARSYAHQLNVVGDYVYIAYGLSGLRIIDATNITHPSLAGVYMMGDFSQKLPVTHLAAGNSHALVFSATDNTFELVDISEPYRMFRVYAGSGDLGDSVGKVTLSSSLLYVLRDGRYLDVFNVSDSSDPEVIGSVAIGMNSWERFFAVSRVVDNRLYISGSNGFYVVDVSNPSNPQVVGSLTEGRFGAGGYVAEVSASGDLVYSDFYGPLRVINVSNPSVPQLVGDRIPLTGASNGVDLVGNLLYVASGYSGLQIVNVSDPNNPQIVGAGVDTPGRAYDLVFSANLVYLADNLMGLQVIDVSNASRPQIVGSVDTPGYAKRVGFSADVVYVVGGFAGVHVINVSDASNPRIVDHVSTEDWARAVYVSDHWVYISDRSGLQVIDTNKNIPSTSRSSFSENKAVVNWLLPHGGLLFYTSSLGLTTMEERSFVAGINTFASARGVSVSGTLAYVADYNAGLQVVDVSDVNNPQIMGSVSVQGAEVVGVSGRWAYVNGDVFQIIDVSDPQFPSMRGSVRTGDRPTGLSISGNLVSVTLGQFGIQLIDVSDVFRPSVVSSFSGWAYGVHLTSDLLYSGTGSFEHFVNVFDVSDPYNPQFLSHVKTPSYYDEFIEIWSSVTPHELTVSDDCIYATAGNAGLLVIDASDISNLQIVSNTRLDVFQGYAVGVTVSSPLVYLAMADAGLYVMDASDRSHPQLERTYDTPGRAQAVSISDGVAYVADDTGGLQVFDLSIQRGVFITDGAASQMVAVDNTAYLADTEKNLYVLNITDTQAVVALSRYFLAHHAVDMAVLNNTLCVSEGPDGIEIIDVSNKAALSYVGSITRGIQSARAVSIDNNRLYVNNADQSIVVFDLDKLSFAAPTIVKNELILNERETRVLTPNDLMAIDPNADDVHIEFLVGVIGNGQFEHLQPGVVISRFNQQQINNGEIRFVSITPDNSQTPQAFYQVAAFNGFETVFMDALIDFNARPYLINNQVTTARGEMLLITSEQLSASDLDDNDDDLVFEISGELHGEFIWRNSTVVNAFEQRAITQREIYFHHDGSKIAPNYQVRVMDRRMYTENERVSGSLLESTLNPADNTLLIVAASAGGVVGLGLLTAGLFAARRYAQNKRSRKRYPFEDKVAQALKLSDVDNFKSSQGQAYLAAMEVVSAALTEQGFDLDDLIELDQKELAEDVAIAIEHEVVLATTCTGNHRIDFSELSNKSDEIAQHVLLLRSNVESQHL